MNQVRDLFPDPGLTSRVLERLRRILWEPGVAPAGPDLRSEGKPKEGTLQTTCLTDITGDTIVLSWKSCRTPTSSSRLCAAQREPVRRFWTGVWPGRIRRSWGQLYSRNRKN